MRQAASVDILGRRLVAEGIISEDQLLVALQSQEIRKGERGLLGKILVEKGFCAEADIARSIANRAGVPFISLEEYPVNGVATATISADTAKRYDVFPIDFENDKLVVAMRRPADLLALDDLRIISGFNIKPVMVTDSELDAAIKNFAQSSVGVEHSAGAEDGEAEAETVGEVRVAEDKPAVQLANVIVAQAVSAKASDVHIEVYEKTLRVRFRIDGVLHDIMTPPRQIHAPLVSRLKIMANMNIAERRIPQDGRITVKIDGKVVDVRVASLPASFGERLTLRLLERTTRVITMEELGIAPGVLQHFRKAVAKPYGFIPVTGPTGSGKSTTLYAALGTVDRVEKNVITLEDPVEYRMEGINQIQINPKAGLTFASGLRSILRSDPDIIMVGEIRDHETARIAVESALTGHLVFTTLHTNDSAGAITRLTEMEIEPYLTASSLLAILAQRLVRQLCAYCREEYTVDAAELSLQDFPLEQGEETVPLYRAKPGGCIRCSKTGYSGRTGVYELLPVSESIQRLTLERKSASEIRNKAIEEGMITLRQDGLMKVRQGITSLDELMRVII